MSHQQELSVSFCYGITYDVVVVIACAGALWPKTKLSRDFFVSLLNQLTNHAFIRFVWII